MPIWRAHEPLQDRRSALELAQATDPAMTPDTPAVNPGISAQHLLAVLAANGITRLTGVPCSSMIGLINTAQAGTLVPYANAPNEGEALAYAAGVWLGGQRAAMLCQNSGLGNLFNCLTSLCLPYQIPTLLLCGWRGMPGIADEPQHRTMGQITPTLFAAVDVPHAMLTADSELRSLLNPAHFDQRSVQAILIAPGAMAAAKAETIAPRAAIAGVLEKHPGQPNVQRREVIRRLAGLAGGGVGVVVSTGLLAREYFGLAAGPNVLCMAGSMGHAATLGLGVHASSGVPMLVIEGDGSLLMRPQGLGFVASERPAAFCHLVIDNAVHESTGGQPSLSPIVDLAAAAIAFGYPRAVDTTDLDIALDAARQALSGAGPVLVRLRILGGGATPPRITQPFAEMAARFREAMVTLAGPPRAQ